MPPLEPSLALDYAGELLWILAYVLFVRVGFRDRTYSLPVLAIALNFVWEVKFSILTPPGDVVVRVLHLVWLGLDAILVGQLFWFGRREQSIPEMRRFFIPIVIATFMAAFIGQSTFISLLVSNALPGRALDSAFRVGALDAFMINFVMSVLFVPFYFNRRDLRGISYGAAWAKMLGTAVISIANIMASGGRPGGFPLFLYVSIFLFDVIYVYLIREARMRLAAQHQSPTDRPSLLPT